MKILAVLVLSCVAVCFAVPKLPAYNPPKTHDEFDLGPGKYRFGLKPLEDARHNCWYLRFRVKSSNTIFIQFSAEDEDGSDKSYEVMIGAWNNKNTCIRKGRGDNFILDKSTKNIINKKWQDFYIKQCGGNWEIGNEENGKVIATASDDNVFDVKYVGVKSEKKSWWKIERIGFGRRLIRQDIHNPGKYVWAFPEILPRNFYFEFGVKSGRDAYIVFSPTNGYGDDIYEIMIGVQNNFFSCLRRKKGKDPIVDANTLDILHKDQFRYFWVDYNFKEGRLRFGRLGEKEPIIDFKDENPLRIRYFGITSIKVKSWWRFYTPAPEPLYICEHESYEMRCPRGEKISINYALYGRDNGAFCYRKGLKKRSGCGDEDKSYEVIRRECAGKQNCKIRAKNDVFGDPCYGTFKYLQLDYSCCKCD